MKTRSLITATFMAAGALVLGAQEREVPKDSARISIPGCARDRVFIVLERENEPIRADIAPGRRFRLNGPKKLLDEIKKQQGSMVEVTGLVRQSDLAGPGGITTNGGRVRIGGGPPRQPLGASGRDIGYSEAILDLESWRPLPESCNLR
jgi:hypothetical protein